MSLWSTIEGTVSLHDSSHLSLHKAIKEFISDDEVCVKIHQKRYNNTIIEHSVNISWCADGMLVAEHVERLIKSIKSADINAQIDFNVNIRWVA